MKNLIVRADDSTITSASIISCTYTEEVNSGEELTFGCTSSAQLEVTVRGLDNPITAGERIKYYQVDDSDVSHLMNVMIATAPTIVSKTSYKFYAYDAISGLDVDVSDWLRDSQSIFPISLLSFAQTLCAHCGVAFATASFPNDDYMVKAFYADGLTGRQLMGFVAEIAGRYLSTDDDGSIILDWYSSNASADVEPSNGVSGGVTHYGYFAGTLNYEDYETAPIDRVQIHQGATDVGVIYPPDATGNTYQMSNNILMTGAESAELETIAENLFNELDGFTYRPCNFRIPRTWMIRAGDIFTATDINGVTINAIAMRVNVSPNGTSVESTGSASREESGAVAMQSYSNIYGRMLTVEQNVDGLRVRNTELNGDLAELALSVEGISTTVQANKQASDDAEASLQSQITQNASSVMLRFNDVDGALANLAEETDDRFADIQSYIRATPSGVEIGRVGSDVTTSVDNDSFDVNINGNSVASFAVDGATMPNATIPEGGSLTMGKFRWTPRSSGNLSLLYVG